MRYRPETFRYFPLPFFPPKRLDVAAERIFAHFSKMLHYKRVPIWRKLPKLFFGFSCQSHFPNCLRVRQGSHILHGAFDSRPYATISPD
jgi:hypothetical protein